LSRFDPRNESFRNYDVLDGLQGNDFFPRCRARTADGQLFFGGANGLSAFYPDKLIDNPTLPPVVITDFELFNKPVTIGGRDSPLRQAIHVATSITLRYDQSVFRFQFAALNYTAPQKNRYAYKLDGFDRDWQYTDATRRFATYTNLDHGDYTFRVKASNNDGVWNEQGVALHIRILPPWWSTSWFRALAMASVLLSIWCAYRLRVRQLRREFNAQLDGRVDERMRIARELHDTLLQSVQGLMFSFQAARNLLPGRTEEAMRTLDRAIRAGDAAIGEGRNAIQGLRSDLAPEANFEHLLTAAAKELATSSRAEGETPIFQVAVEGVPQPLSPLLQDEVYRIAREFLLNAFRHARASRIEAEIAYDNAFFRLRVRDNGKGIDPSILETGARQGHWGLPGIRERAKRMGAHLKIWSEPGAGTEAEVTVPARIAYRAIHRHVKLALFRKNSVES
jgi:signal transduction histidine kinase